MIKAIYILNTAGKVRLVRVFDETVSAWFHIKRYRQWLIQKKLYKNSQQKLPQEKINIAIS
jgi:hypothetical protein